MLASQIMAQTGWGTQIEIIAAATMFQVFIWVVVDSVKHPIFFGDPRHPLIILHCNGLHYQWMKQPDGPLPVDKRSPPIAPPADRSIYSPHDQNDVNGILQCIFRHKNSYELDKICLPTPSSKEKLVMGLSFQQLDYSISFTPFLLRIPNFPESLAESSAAKETFRCFFLHLGVATGIHPFALQEVFRRHCRRIRDAFERHPYQDRYIGDKVERLYGIPTVPEDILSVLQNKTNPFKPDDRNYVDFAVLQACWPIEFDNVRILLWITAEQRACLYDPRNDSSPGRTEVVIAFESNHFTLLRGLTISAIEKTCGEKRITFTKITGQDDFLHLNNREWPPGKVRCSLADLNR
jgi:hypothetical protein